MQRDMQHLPNRTKQFNLEEAFLHSSRSVPKVSKRIPTKTLTHAHPHSCKDESLGSCNVHSNNGHEQFRRSEKTEEKLKIARTQWLNYAACVSLLRSEYLTNVFVVLGYVASVCVCMCVYIWVLHVAVYKK